jgi:hypothetical protein
VRERIHHERESQTTALGTHGGHIGRILKWRDTNGDLRNTQAYTIQPKYETRIIQYINIF